MKIQVQVTTLYGRQAIYPICDSAKTLADIAGTRTLTPEVIGLINGIERQRGKFDDLLFSVEQIIAYLSTGVGLRAGDVICTGTPGQLPPSPEFADRVDNNPKIKVRGVVNLRPGDVATVTIPGIGTLENPVIADIPAKHVRTLNGSVERAAS
mgnify:CR=1 FL=1